MNQEPMGCIQSRGRGGQFNYQNNQRGRGGLRGRQNFTSGAENTRGHQNFKNVQQKQGNKRRKQFGATRLQSCSAETKQNLDKVCKTGTFCEIVQVHKRQERI